MARSAFLVTQGQFQNVTGMAALQAKLAALPDAVTQRVGPAVERGANRLAQTARAAAPVSDLERNPGELRDSIRVEPGRIELERKVVADGADAKGRPIAKHVEYGHQARDGTHVAARPFMWPAYRVERRRIKSDVSRGVNAGVKAAAAIGGPG